MANKEKNKKSNITYIVLVGFLGGVILLEVLLKIFPNIAKEIANYVVKWYVLVPILLILVLWVFLDVVRKRKKKQVKNSNIEEPKERKIIS